MAKSKIPNYRRRKNQNGPVARVFIFIVKLIVFFVVGSVLWVIAYRFVPPPTTATMIGDMVAGRGATRDWMPIREIDRDMVRAAIGAEDSKFCSHDGFDWDAIQDAAKRNASGGKIRGGSTISQQTAKTTFLWNGGGYPRKVVEAWFTFLIENIWGKRRIMEVYLNNAETGIGTYGVNAGSMRYYGHDASAMSASEAARIAAVLPLPKKRGAITPKGFTRSYGNTIAARIGTVGRDGLDACVYKNAAAPVDRAPPVVRGKRPQPGADYENPPTDAAPSQGDADSANAVVADPLAPAPPQPEPQILPMPENLPSQSVPAEEPPPPPAEPTP